MKKEIAEQWVKALRSGKYAQGKKQLKYDDKYCCLGVLCDISKLSSWEETAEKYSDVQNKYFSVFNHIPLEIQNWSGVKTDYGSLSGQILNHSLASMNDRGESFEAIADVIERDWEKL